MVNLVAGRPIVPELIQDDFTPEAVAREAVSLLTDAARADEMRRDLADVRAKLGGPGASERAAEGSIVHRSVLGASLGGQMPPRSGPSADRENRSDPLH